MIRVGRERRRTVGKRALSECSCCRRIGLTNIRGILLGRIVAYQMNAITSGFGGIFLKQDLPIVARHLFHRLVRAKPGWHCVDRRVSAGHLAPHNFILFHHQPHMFRSSHFDSRARFRAVSSKWLAIRVVVAWNRDSLCCWNYAIAIAYYAYSTDSAGNRAPHECV